jgi:phosphoserine phosphatase
MSLPTRNWHEPNRAALDAALARWRERAQDERLVAVFDFDNTTIFHDAGEAAMRWQLDRGAFRVSADELAAMLPDEIDGVRALADGTPLAALREQLTTLRRALDDDGAGDDEARAAWRAEMVWAYWALDETPGIGATFAYPFLARWLGGFTADEARGLARDAVAMAQAEPFGEGAWQSPARPERRAEFETGLSAQPEMIDLFTALQDAGVEVFVVTASMEHVVEGAVEALGYPVPRENVFGMRLREGEAGRLTPDTLDPVEYPRTYRPGKQEVIERFIGAAPVLVGGDSDTDFEMLTGFEATELRLVINRNPRAGDILSILDDERTLLQGRHEPEGRFHPARETEPL